MKILDVGCGQRKRENAIGIDVNPRSQADLIHDLNVFPWPSPDDEFDLIYCHHILEHLDDVVGTIEEIHRIARNGAVVEIRTPHFSSLYSWQDPTHRHHFALESFDYFTEQTNHTRFYTDRRFRIVEKRIEFGKSLISFLPRLIAWFSVHKYEKHFAFIFPANDLFFRLQVVK